MIFKYQKLVAVLSAIVAALAMREFLKPATEQDHRKTTVNGSLSNAYASNTVGEILEIEGRVLVKPPRSHEWRAAETGPFNLETLIQTESVSAAVIRFQSERDRSGKSRPGPILRLLENSKLITVIDPSKNNGLQVTVLSGGFKIIHAGENSDLSILQNGVAVDYHSKDTFEKSPSRPVPIVSSDSEENSFSESTVNETTPENSASVAPLSVAPLSVSPPAAPTAAPQELGSVSPLLRTTLTNDDIRSQVRAQSGGFQKCYVGMVNRLSESGKSLSALPSGETRVAFKILSVGKVDSPKVIQAPFHDPVFERCMAEALGRLRFRPFQGAAVSVAEFPISLE